MMTVMASCSSETLLEDSKNFYAGAERSQPSFLLKSKFYDKLMSAWNIFLTVNFYIRINYLCEF